MDEVVPRKVQLALRAMLMSDPVDSTPMEIPEELMRQESLEERLQAFVKAQLSQAAVESGFGSEEEENDFSWPGIEDLDEDPSELSVYQVQLMQEEFPVQRSESEELSGSEAGETPRAQVSVAEPEAAVEQPPTEPAQQASNVDSAPPG